MVLWSDTLGGYVLWRKTISGNALRKHMHAISLRKLGGSNEYPHSMFWSKNKKNRYTPQVWSYGVTLWEATSYGEKPYQVMHYENAHAICSMFSAVKTDIFL